MAFNVTYGALQSHNIKHLYTTREKTMHQKIPRQKLYRPARLTKKPAVKSNPRGCGHYQRGFHEYEWEEDMTSPSEPVPARKNEEYSQSSDETLWVWKAAS
ncbi:hypothetical protein DPMN_151960 [Dreissena polymorpha]|uniref:Uncharacterized protein n=1 Tax=Dreissena polymorpha TaxID=45954 RepID=A0A9D4FI37_DREPO|nr:hypothetical protein DPMN_151960 [Dreissena polymorpha]